MPRSASCRVVVIAGLLLVASVVTPLVAHAAWLPGGNPVGTLSNEQWVSFAAGDAERGAFVSWKHSLDAYLQRFTANGSYAAGWPEAGMRIEHLGWGPHARTFPVAVIPDGAGGVYAVSFDGTCGPSCYFDEGWLFVRRVTADASLDPKWPADGQPIEDGRLMFSVQDHIQVLPRARGGLVLAWSSDFPGAPGGPRSVVAQALAPDGTRRWGLDGLVLAQGVDVQPEVTLVSDPDGGAYVFWADRDSTKGGPVVRGQRINASGRTLWRAGGVVVSRGWSEVLDGPVAVDDGGRGAIVSWMAGGRAGLGVFAARIERDGRLTWGHDVPLSAVPRAREGLRIAATDAGGVVAAWLESQQGAPRALFAQRIDRGGHPQWSASGRYVGTVVNSIGRFALAPDGGDGAYLAWSGVSPQGELLATHLTPRGRTAAGWPDSGAVICSRPPLNSTAANVDALVLARVGRDRAFLAWSDDRLVAPNNPTELTLSFATLLAPDGPAASSLASQRPGVLADPIAADPATAPSTAFALRGVQPNPAPAGATVAFALPDARPASLELFDVAGRRVWSREVGVLGAGEHVVPLRDGEHSPTGLYLIRLRQAERVATTRVVLVR